VFAMSQRSIIAALTLAGGLCVAAEHGHAAVVASQTGAVLANFGDGFRGVKPSETLPVGTQVMVPPNGLAQIGFGGGCFVTVVPGQVYTVPPSAPCAAGLENGAGQVGGTTILTGGAIIAGGVGAGVLLLHHHPASP